VYDRGQLLVDLAVTQLLGGEAISDFQGLRHLAPVIGPVPSTPTVWRAMAEVGERQLSRINAAVTVFRRHWWRLLAARPDGFPWLKVAGRELTGITVVDLDASIVFAASDKENAAPTYKGGIGFSPNLASCDNTDDLLAIDPRPGNATANDAADNIALLDQAVERLPGRYRRRMLIRLDGAGFSHELLEHIAAGGKVNGRNWEFSAGWSCTDREMNAIAQLPDQAWTAAIEQNGEPVENAYVAELTGLLDLKAWQQKIPGLRVLVRDEPLHPRYRKRATDREKALGRRFQLIVTNTQVGQIAWLDARHRSHVHVENDPAGQIVGLVRRVVIVLSVLGLHDLPAVGSSLTPGCGKVPADVCAADAVAGTGAGDRGGGAGGVSAPRAAVAGGGAGSAGGAVPGCRVRAGIWGAGSAGVVAGPVGAGHGDADGGEPDRPAGRGRGAGQDLLEVRVGAGPGG
jgi:hypothetical protein